MRELLSDVLVAVLVVWGKVSMMAVAVVVAICICRQLGVL